MNEELIRQCAREAADAAPCDGADDYACTVTAGVEAIRLYHARHVAPLVEPAMEARRIAMEQTVAGRVPECGKFGDIAQDLDAALAPFQQEARAAALSALAEADGPFIGEAK